MKTVILDRDIYARSALLSLINNADQSTISNPSSWTATSFPLKDLTSAKSIGKIDIAFSPDGFRSAEQRSCSAPSIFTKAKNGCKVIEIW